MVTVDKSIIRQWGQKHLPLIEAVFSLVKIDNFEELLTELNELGEDIQADKNVWNLHTGNTDITFDATPDAMLRVFGWEIVRTCDDVRGPYYWKELNKPTRFPDCLIGKVLDVGLAQPGRCDDAQPFENSQV